MAIDTEPPPPAAAEMDLDQADEAPPPTQQPEAAHHHEDDGGADAQSRGRATTSPPMPQKHVAVTPGPRAARLRDLHAQALHHTLAKLGWDNFAACFPTVARRNEPVLRQVQAQMVAKLADKVQKEFDNIMAARLVVPKLNDLEALVADAAQRRRAAAAAQGEQGDPTPPHLLPPDRILAAHLAPALADHRAHITASLHATQAQNALLFDRAREQRAEIDHMLDRLEAALADARGANDALRPVVEQLAAEARASQAAIAEAGADKIPAVSGH